MRIISIAFFIKIYQRIRKDVSEMKKCKSSLHCLFCLSLLVLNVDIISMSWNWFEAQRYCSKDNDTLEYNASSNSTVDFWSGVYKRHSLWIKILGCYDLNAVQHHEEFQMHYPSAGFCQEMCTTVNSTIFGIKKNKCVCIKSPVLARTIPSNFCNEACNQDSSDIQFSECGGSNAYTLYIADIDTPESTNLTSTEFNRKSACLAINCGTVETFSISSGCSESYSGVCEDKGYLGCFEDQWSRTLKDGPITSDKTTVTECKNICSEKKTKYYGVENSNECFCGNNITSRVEKPEGECNMQCRGDVRQICGGSWGINIYRNPYYKIGCCTNIFIKYRPIDRKEFFLLGGVCPHFLDSLRLWGRVGLSDFF
ncbi:uncharacterized protein LOC134243202 isoform X1 [Saccostrea cucullata]|uniref:uncharacterized protein LOC134243202 isoform X1 n=1 Tax=Saccostrea cuccullata TaxID=36930 RepID=UPI002ED64218